MGYWEALHAAIDTSDDRWLPHGLSRTTWTSTHTFDSAWTTESARGSHDQPFSAAEHSQRRSESPRSRTQVTGSTSALVENESQGVEADISQAPDLRSSASDLVTPRGGGTVGPSDPLWESLK